MTREQLLAACRQTELRMNNEIATIRKRIKKLEWRIQRSRRLRELEQQDDTLLFRALERIAKLS